MIFLWLFIILFAVILFTKLVPLFIGSNKGYLPWLFSDGGRAAANLRPDAEDCVTRAVAIVTGEPYVEVYQKINEIGRVYGQAHAARTGSNLHTLHAVMDHYGGSWVQTRDPEKQERSSYLAKGYVPRGRLVVHIPEHVAAVIDGVIYDDHDPQRDESRVLYGYWRFQ